MQARASTREIPYTWKSSCYICFVVVIVFTWVKQIWYDLLEFARNKQGNTEIKQNNYFSLLCVFSRNFWCFCFYMSMFDCKCKSLNRLGENRKTNRKKQKSFEKNKNANTGYPALDPTANKYLSGSGWEMMYFCFFVFLFFSKLFMFVCFYVFFFRL